MKVQYLFICAKIKIIFRAASNFCPICYHFVILPHFYVLFKAEKRNGNMTVKMIDVCQFITFIEKKSAEKLVSSHTNY